VEAIYPEFHAKILTQNLTAMHIHSVQPIASTLYAPRQHPYQINFKEALAKMKNNLLLSFTEETFKDLLNRLLTLFLRTIEPVRPRRQAPREIVPKPNHFPVCYKQAA